MQAMRVGLLTCVLLGRAVTVASEETGNPMSKVIGLLQGLTAKITWEGEMEAKQYKKWFEWCDEESKQKMYEIKTLSTRKAELEATIDEQNSDIDVSTSKIEELVASVSGAEAELNNATAMRKKEAMDFVAADTELTDVVDTLGRAAAVLDKHLKGGASFAQLGGTALKGVLQSLEVITEAASLASTDRARLLELVQRAQGGDARATDAASESDEDALLGAPAAAVYKSGKSASIVEVLEEMKEKAETQLQELRKVEMKARQEFELLRQELQRQIKEEDDDMGQEKGASAASAETAAQATSDLAMTTKDLKDAENMLADTKQKCLQVGADREHSITSRTEELKVVADVTANLQKNTGGAADNTYSFMQESAAPHGPAHTVLAFVKRLADKHRSHALAQLASKLGVVLRFGSHNGGRVGRDVFDKVKGLISDMIARLEKEAQEEAEEKKYCDKNMAETVAKKEELTDMVDGLNTKIDQTSAGSTKLKEEVKATQAELAKLVKSMAAMDAMREEEHAEYEEVSTDLKQGLVGVQRAIGMLNDYYAKGDDAASFLQEESEADQPKVPIQHSTDTGSGGAATGIIGMLEVIEQDFSTNLADKDAAEAEAQSKYEKITQDSKVEKAQFEKDIEYKTLEFKRLDKQRAEAEGDLTTEQSRLDAVLEFQTKLTERCVAKPEAYEERAARQQAEIDGLQEALSILGNDGVDMSPALAQLRGRRSRAKAVRAASLTVA